MSEPLLRAVHEEGYRAPTALQRNAIPAILEGRDVLATAQTGTGKTATYALPILEKLAAAGPADQPRALVLAATREVAAQILEAFETLGRYANISAVALVESDATAAAQEAALREGRDVLIATPGRLLDLVDLGLAQVGAVTMLALDEVEELYQQGLLSSVARVAGLISPRPQTLLFSAEMTDSVRALANDLLDQPATFEIAPRTLTVDHVDQRVIFTSRESKGALLGVLLNDPATTRVLVYLRSRRAAQKLQRQLKDDGIDCELGRPARVQIVTDGNARRVKLTDLSHVVNYDVPGEVEVYVHRVGRSVRAGSGAIAITLCDEAEREALTAIETTLKASLTVMDNPLPPAEAARQPRPAREPHEARRDERPPREPRRDERPPRDNRREDRPPREDRRPERSRSYEDETLPAAVITFVSAPHPQVKKTMEEWFAEREERSPLEDAAVAAYIVEHPEFAPKKPAPKQAQRSNGREGGDAREPREARNGNRNERSGGNQKKRQRVRGGQRRGGRRGPSGSAPNPSSPA
ncbi:MAG: DEAD/DEAH box helicase [Anaerolineae bacterium]|nr:DEAD/DEAH box helicase [Anaerolineae bacterium]